MELHEQNLTLEIDFPTRTIEGITDLTFTSRLESTFLEPAFEIRLSAKQMQISNITIESASINQPIESSDETISKYSQELLDTLKMSFYYPLPDVQVPCRIPFSLLITFSCYLLLFVCSSMYF
jgi:hypothetical protein